MTEQGTPFTDLPAALVEEVIEHTSLVGDKLIDSFRKMKSEKENYRKKLEDSEILIHESVLGYPVLPTTCGADGSYAINRLLSLDLVAAAAVAVEGLTPPSEKRHWSQPRHLVYVASEAHHPDTATVLRALMMGNELTLAVNAPHELVMFDGTLTLPTIYFNQALNKAAEVPVLKCAKEFIQAGPAYLKAYQEMLLAPRSDKVYVGIPKYSTRKEIGRRYNWAAEYDDRGMLTYLLKAGELTKPMPIEQPQQAWHINVRALQQIAPGIEKTVDMIIQGLQQLFVFYYKPHEYLPALRIELARSIATNKNRMALVVQGLKHQCATASMLEPYPLYLADRTVKALSRSIPTFKQVATQRVAEKYEGTIDEVFFSLHGYRSEEGG